MTSGDQTEEREHWHLDRRVPIAILVIVGIQTLCFLAAGGFYVGADQQWKKHVEVRLDAIPTKIPPDKVVARLTALEKAVAVMNANQKNSMATLIAVAERLNVIPPPSSGR